MLFNSFEFIFIFLPVVWFGYYGLNRNKFYRGALIWLVAASLVFYAYWNPKYVLLIAGSIVFNFFVGRRLSKMRQGQAKRALLTFGIVANVALLFFYKYFNFALENISTVLGWPFEPLQILLPLGISFFTFQKVAYLVDSYKGLCKDYDFIRYCLFVTFFPQLIAGPIVHHRQVMPQFESPAAKKINYDNIAKGFFLFTMGLFKKVVIADSLSPIVHQGFDVSVSPSFFEAWHSLFAYTFQLYFDFSGYSDMAIGLALLFNIRLPDNFNSPYKALHIQDFWRRWHITLSAWLKDYIYIPLGGSRRGDVRTAINLFATFLVGGIWHGASWNFVVWGMLHGAALLVYRLWATLKTPLPKPVAWALTFFFVQFSWVFFRAKDLIVTKRILAALVNFGEAVPLASTGLGLFSYNAVVSASVVFGLLGFCLLAKNSVQCLKELKWNWSTAFLTAVVALASFLNFTKVSEFLYFQF